MLNMPAFSAVARMNEFIEQFLEESRELVEQTSRDLLALEKDPTNKDLLDGTFRGFHTLKGGSAIVDFEAMTRALHAAENVLSSVRSNIELLTQAVIGDCLDCLDQVAKWLDAVDPSGAFPTAANFEADIFVARFSGSAAATVPINHYQHESGLPPSAHNILSEQILMLSEGCGQGFVGRFTSAAKAASNVLISCARSADAQRVKSALAEALEANDPAPIISAIAESLSNRKVTAESNAGVAIAPDVGARSFRVEAARVDALVNLTSELTVAKNSIGYIAKLAQETENNLASVLADKHAELNRVVSALQHALLSIRVLPLRQVFQRFPRLVRELSVSLGKIVRLETQGDDTEVDKVVIEALYEPLLHILRNAIDHGVEMPTQRSASRKPEVATIQMRGRREGDIVVIEVEDDGAGVDVARVRLKAVERGLLSTESAAVLTDAEAIDVIFEPGFSTSFGVTDLSGRGVGMNVVRSAAERLGGRVSMESVLNRGSTVRFELPFSVMMTQLMTVEAGGQLFGIPLDAVVESVRVPRDRIRPVGAALAIAHRDRTLPVLDLTEALGRGKRALASSDPILVIVSHGGQMGALEVDKLGARVDVMLKPTGGLMSRMEGVSGTTVLGDGSVLLILDVHALLS